jgi:hypothetical protein
MMSDIRHQYKGKSLVFHFLRFTIIPIETSLKFLELVNVAKS